MVSNFSLAKLYNIAFIRKILKLEILNLILKSIHCITDSTDSFRKIRMLCLHTFEENIMPHLLQQTEPECKRILDAVIGSFISLKATEHIARVIMLYYTEKAATVAIVVLMTIALCSTDIQEVRTQFVKNKVLSTSYATKQHISKLNCVQWCSRDRQMGKCKIAGYNKYSKMCSLSMDNPEDALDVADEMTGIFVIEQQEGDTVCCYIDRNWRLTLILLVSLKFKAHTNTLMNVQLHSF